MDTQLVRKGREEELKFVKKHDVYVRATREECWKETGRSPIKTGWAETNKGSLQAPNVRCRWVAKEYNTGARPDLYAATPPLEAVKLVLSEAATNTDKQQVVCIVDVRRAYFYAPVRRRVYVELPPEDWQEGDENMCGRLQQSLYGTRDAAQNWEEELGSKLTSLGFRRGKASPCVCVGRKSETSSQQSMGTTSL